MEIIAYGAENYIEALKKHLARFEFETPNVNILEHLSEGNVGSVRYIRLCMDGFSQAEDDGCLSQTVNSYLSEALAEVFIRDIGIDYTRRLIDSVYSFLSEEERRSITEGALAILNSSGPISTVSYGKNGPATEGSRRERVEERILEYLKENNALILEGFFRFRLRDYVAEIKNAIDNSVDKFLLEREYVEFINLLRYFVELQEPQTGEVHVIKRLDGLYRLLDRDGIIIDSEYLEGFISDIVDSDIDYDDLLVSALITMAPVRIVLHFGEKSRIVGTLEGIFGDRVKVCGGCDYFCVALGKNTKG